MHEFYIKEQQIEGFRQYLKSEERAAGTIDKYIRDVRKFIAWLSGREISKELVCEWKEELVRLHYKPTTINSMLASLHGFFKYADIKGCSVKFLKIQRRMFREQSRELSKEEYRQLVNTAQKQGQERISLLIEAIGATGIRVSEVKYLTVEAAKCGRADIALKGKIRTILIPAQLSRKLLKYAKSKKIVSGEIFLTRNKTSLSRKQIWAEMKALCNLAGVERTKVFPHNLRHMFARVFYKASKDIVRLADVLGHSSIETTRIYLLTTSTEYMNWLNGLRLVY